MAYVLDPKGALQAHMQGFDAIVAVTENNINANLKFLYGANDGIRSKIDIGIENEDARLQAIIAPPKVKLRVDGQPHSVLFIVTLLSGSFEYWTGHGPKAQKHSLPIDHWTIGFKVNLNLADASAVPPAVQAQVKNLGAGMFSVRQLFMDFQNANLAEWDKTTTVVPASVQGDPGAQGYFQSYMTEYLTQVRAAGDHILGYAIRVTNPNAVEPEHPTFPPTDLTFATNRFMPDGVTPSPESGLDTLNFLMMTEKRTFPVNVLPWSGNWVGSPDVYGTIAISRAAFVNGYLLPTLANCTNLSTRLVKTGDLSVGVTSWAGAPFTLTADGGSYASPPVQIVLPHYEGALETFPSDYAWSVAHSCRVSVAGGGNVISVSGRSEVEHHVTVWGGVKYHALTEEVWQHSVVDWSATITLDSVAAGSLNLKVSVNVPEPTYSSGGNLLGRLQQALNPNFEKHGKDIADLLKRLLNQSELADRLKRALTAHSRFVFPGGQQFTMYDAVFNSERDLIAKVTYNFY